METKFQWGMYTDASKQEHYVVRCDEIQELVEAIALVKAAIQEQREAASLPTLAEPAAPEQVVTSQLQEPSPSELCPIHNQIMHQRQAKNGATWLDHRWQTDGIWYRCNGTKVKAQQPASNSAGGTRTPLTTPS